MSLAALSYLPFPVALQLKPGETEGAPRKEEVSWSSGSGSVAKFLTLESLFSIAD